MSIPEELVVVGGGGGGVTIAAEFSLAGSAVTIADLPEFAGNLSSVAEAGGVNMQFRSGPSDSDAPSQFVPIKATSCDPSSAVSEAETVIVCVPSYGHKRFAELLIPHLQEGQTVLWVGEGGGAFTAIAEARRSGARSAVHAETNSLPYGGAFIKGPASVGATRKTGGTVLAALPASETPRVISLVQDVWPWVSAGDTSWESLLLNFNAIDHVATMVCNLGPIQGSGTYRIWGTGGTPGVASVISAVDAEYRSLRRALGVQNDKGWEDYLVEQGMVSEKGATTYDTIQQSILAQVELPCGPNALDHRFVAEDVPYSLVLASTIGDELDIDTPVMDGLISIASAASGRDYRSTGRTLADWAMTGLGRHGLQKAAEDGWW